jgi:preprotein translocase subunit SecY
MERITYVGAGFLALIAVIPTLVSQQLGIPYFVSQFLGGTGLLIVVSVGLDLIQRIEANLLMRNYSGFLSRSPADRSAPRVRSARG